MGPPTTNLTVVTGDRRSGKTRDLLRWVLDGKRCDGYPGWTRVLVVSSVGTAERLKDQAVRIEGEKRGVAEYADLDYAHRVYGWEEWREARNVDPYTEVAYDDAEFLLWQIKAPGRLVRLSISADEVIVRAPWNWQQQ